MATDDGYETVQDFLSKMDAGELEDKLVQELGKLTSEQRGELALILMERKIGRHAIG